MSIHSKAEPPPSLGGDGEAGPATKFQRRTGEQADPAQDDDPPDTDAVIAASPAPGSVSARRACPDPESRYKFITQRGYYHGATHGCLSLGGGGSNTGAEYGPLPYGGVRVQGPDEYRNPFARNDGTSELECAHEIERARFADMVWRLNSHGIRNARQAIAHANGTASPGGLTNAVPDIRDRLAVVRAGHTSDGPF